MIQKLRSKTYNLLRWSEKFFKTDMVYLAKGGSWLTLGQGVASVSALLLSIAFANLVPKEVYGEYKYVLSLAGIIGAFSLTGMGTAVTQATARGFDGTLSQGFHTSLRWSVGIVIISFTSAMYYFLNDNFTLAISLLIVGALTPLLNSGILYGVFLNGKKDFKTPAIYTSIENMVSVLMLIITMIITENPVLFILTYFATHTCFSILFYFLTIKKYPQGKNTDTNVIEYSKHLSAMNIFGTLAMHLDKILIFHYLGATQLAVYAFAIAVPEQIKGIIKGIITLTLPKFAKTTLKKINKTIYQKMITMIFILLVIVMSYIIMAPTIFKILFPKYLESVIYSQIFIISIVTAALFLPLSALHAQKNTEALYKFNVSISIFQFIIVAMLTYMFGLIGAIFARVISRFFNMILAVIILKSYAKNA